MSSGRSGKRFGLAFGGQALIAMARAEWLVTWAGPPVALAAVLAALPHRVAGPRGTDTSGFTLPFLPGIAFAPIGAPAAVGEIAYDWLIWEMLMASTFTLATLSTLKVGRMMADARWSAERIQPAPPPAPAVSVPEEDAVGEVTVPGVSVSPQTTARVEELSPALRTQSNRA